MTDNIPAYGASLILHPSRRKSYILKNWPKKWHKKVFDGVEGLWSKEYKNRHAQTQSQAKILTSEHTDEPDEYDLIGRELDVIMLSTLGKDEYEHFANDQPIFITTSALAWWSSQPQRLAYPRLSQMAIDLLSIPAMSAEAERVFSGARRQISWDRARLGGELIERMECLKHWLTKKVLDRINIEVMEDVLVETDGKVEDEED
jgi:hypothetical protein